MVIISTHAFTAINTQNHSLLEMGGWGVVVSPSPSLNPTISGRRNGAVISPPPLPFYQSVHKKWALKNSWENEYFPFYWRLFVMLFQCKKYKFTTKNITKLYKKKMVISQCKILLIRSSNLFIHNCKLSIFRMHNLNYYKTITFI